MLNNELALYSQQKKQLQLEHPEGGFVVIKDREISGVWPTQMDALKTGIDMYGNVQFLVKNINDSGIKYSFSRDLVFA